MVAPVALAMLLANAATPLGVDLSWKAPLADNGAAGFSACDRAVYYEALSEDLDEVRKLDVTTGAKGWRIDPGPQDVIEGHCTPRLIVFMSLTSYREQEPAAGSAQTGAQAPAPPSKLWAVDIGTGRPKWSFEFADSYGWSWCDARDCLLGTMQAIAVLDTDTGKLRWKAGDFGVSGVGDSIVYGSFAVSDAHVFATTGEEHNKVRLVALNRADGNEAWTADVAYVSGEAKLVSTADRIVAAWYTEPPESLHISAFGESTGKPIWSKTIDAGGVIAADGDLLLVTAANALYGINISDGTQRWRAAVGAGTGDHGDWVLTSKHVVGWIWQETTKSTLAWLERNTGRPEAGWKLPAQVVASGRDARLIAASGDRAFVESGATLLALTLRPQP